MNALRGRRKVTIKRIGNILDHCRSCPNNSKDDHTNCANCDLYIELRSLGDELNDKSKDKGFNIPVELYIDYRKQGLTDKQIATEEGVDVSTIRRWKNRNKDKLGLLFYCV